MKNKHKGRAKRPEVSLVGIDDVMYMTALWRLAYNSVPKYRNPLPVSDTTTTLRLLSCLGLVEELQLL